MSIFKACDLRGVVGQEWDAHDARRIGRSLGHMLRQRQQLLACLGGDFRRSTPELKQALGEGLLEAGVSVDDVGQAATPVVYFAGRQRRCPNVIIVTASHNPGPYNGVKFLLGGRPAIPELTQELQAGLNTPAAAGERGRLRQIDVINDYERWVPRQADLLAAGGSCPAIAPPISGDGSAGAVDSLTQTEGLHVVVDVMGGAMTGLAARILRQAGHCVEVLREGPDPDFAGGVPNPARDTNLKPLIEAVKAAGADLGVALDGDGDRVVFVDNAGQIARPEQIGALLALRCFRRPKVVYDLKCASVLAHAVAAVGGQALMRPSGHGFIKATMLDERADLGVEVSGHHFYGALEGGDDGLLTALLVCRLIACSGRLLRELLAPFPWPAITPDLRLPYSGDATAALEAIAARCGGQVSRLDGVRARYDEGWALARASITEPAVTLRFEGRDRASLHGLAERFLAGVPELWQAIKDAGDLL